MACDNTCMNQFISRICPSILWDLNVFDGHTFLVVDAYFVISSTYASRYQVYMRMDVGHDIDEVNARQTKQSVFVQRDFGDTELPCKLQCFGSVAIVDCNALRIGKLLPSGKLELCPKPRSY